MQANTPSMLADFKAVEPFGKIAIRVLQRHVSMRVSSWITALPEFIHLAARGRKTLLKAGQTVFPGRCLPENSRLRMKYCYA